MADGTGEGTGNGLDPAAALAKLMAAKGDPTSLTPDILREGVRAMGFDPQLVGAILMAPGGNGVGAAAPAAASVPIGAVIEPGGGVTANQRAAAAGMIPRKRKPVQPGQSLGPEGQVAPKKQQRINVEEYLNRAGEVIGQVMAHQFGELPALVRMEITPEGVAVGVYLPEDAASEEERLAANNAPHGRLGDLFVHVVGEAGAVLDSVAEAGEGEGGEEAGGEGGGEGGGEEG